MFPRVPLSRAITRVRIFSVDISPAEILTDPIGIFYHRVAFVRCLQAHPHRPPWQGPGGSHDKGRQGIRLVRTILCLKVD
jgi:hypothetical protein